MKITFLNKIKICLENSQKDSFEINKIIKFTDSWGNAFFGEIVSLEANKIECQNLSSVEIFDTKKFDFQYFSNLELPISATTIGRVFDFDQQTWLENNLPVTILTDLYLDIYKTKKTSGSTKIQNLSHLNISTFVEFCIAKTSKAPIFVVNELAFDTKQLSKLNKELARQNLLITTVQTKFWLPEIADKIAVEIADYYNKALDFEVILVTCGDYKLANVDCFCTLAQTKDILELPDNQTNNSYFAN